MAFAASLLGQDYWPEPNARLRTLVDTTSIQLGEAFLLTITLEVDDVNRSPIQFYKAGWNVVRMHKEIEELGLIFNHNISDIYGVRNSNAAGDSTTRYDLLKLQIEPLRTGELTIPSLEIEMEQFKRDTLSDIPQKERDSKIVSFKTEPVKIDIKPHTGLQNNEGVVLFGTHALEEHLAPGKYLVGDTIDYTLRFSGSGMGINISLPPIATEKFEVLVKKIDYADSLNADLKMVYIKEYALSIIPLKKGKINMTKYFKWDYKEKGVSDIKQLRVGTKIKVRKRKGFEPKKKALDAVLITDLSESMDIEDYAPNSRKGMANELAMAYQALFAQGRVIAFAGSVVDVTDQMTPNLLDSFKITERGTAIGNAVWLGTESLSAHAQKRIIIIIGDGDNTAGNISPVLASQFAKDKDVAIYSIGLGHNGKVPYGKDFYGRPSYVENTFSDKTLKALASITGGRYFYMDDFESPMALMKEIKRTINVK